MVQFQNQRYEKHFNGSYTNIGNNGGNMIGRKYLIISTLAILIALAMVVPAVAAPLTYSVSLSPYGTGSFSQFLSPSKLSLINEYSLQKPGVSSIGTSSALNTQKSSLLSNLQSQTGSPSIGTVSAFSKYKGGGGTSFMEFSDSVSVSGSISLFEYSFSFS